jgi:hypothetical protein
MTSGLRRGHFSAILYGSADAAVGVPWSKDRLSRLSCENLRNSWRLHGSTCASTQKRKKMMWLLALGCAYYTYASGFTPLQWLEYLRNRIREHLEKMQKQDAS